MTNLGEKRESRRTDVGAHVGNAGEGKERKERESEHV